MNPKVDTFFTAGCGRCPRGNTPECNVNKWPEELAALRRMLLDTELAEELKWGFPCYTLQKSNVIMLGAQNDHCVLSFLKGALLKDPHGILKKPGENTQAGRVIRFTNSPEVLALEPILRAYIAEAIEVEQAGLKVAYKKNPEPVPEELQNNLNEIPALKTAFDALTPGRQRGYILHFSAPKQAQTRMSRIEKCIPKILDGIGFHDRVK